MQVVDIQAFSVMIMFAARSIPDSWSRIYRPQGYFEPSEGNFIMQVVDNRAFSVVFAVLFIPDSWSRIYRGILSLLREIL